MCRGTIVNGRQCQLFVDALVGLGSLASPNARSIRFLVDTGATSTLISSKDAVRLGVDYSRIIPRINGVNLKNAGSASGIGGDINIYTLDNVFLTIISKEGKLNEKHTEIFDTIEISDRKYSQESYFKT